VAAAATRLRARLDAAAADGRRAPVCLHGDANLRNAILLGDERIGLIDLEHVSAGPTAADLGQLLAGLLAAERPGGRALLAGYARVAPLPDRAALRWHTAASLLTRVALPAVSRVRPAVLAQLPDLLAAGAELVAPHRRRPAPSRSRLEVAS
jgi:Ser/Thr protein kinase RdoA (MazF antagonist)